MFRYITLPALVVTLAATFIPIQVIAQSVPDLLIAPQASAAPRRNVPARRLRKMRVNLAALDSATVRLELFDDAWPTVSRTSEHRPANDTLVWVGRGEDGTQAVLTVVRGVLTGTVFFDNRTFEVTIDPDGQYTVAELDPAAFPTDDPISNRPQPEIIDAPVEGPVALPIANAAPSGAVQVDAMVVWTPNAEAAAGGRAAMESLALASVANANQVYANSGINAQLNLVYAAPVAYTETPSSIVTDLTAIRSSGDGLIDQVHTLRTQYGADVVTLIGEGYRNAGACGVANLMGTVSTAFASSAFSVVDRSCAVGNLSYAHEIGHNQGLNHDAANAVGTAAYPYALGYQSPSGLFRTVMSYGSAVRIPFLSSPTVSYSGLPTGTSNENNARALTNTISTVAAFKATTTAPAPPTCTYSVSTSSIAFPAAGGSQSVSVTAPSGCSWQAVPDATASWVSLSTSGGSGNGAVTVSAVANAGAARSATVTIAGQAVAVSEAATSGAPIWARSTSRRPVRAPRPRRRRPTSGFRPRRRDQRRPPGTNWGGAAAGTTPRASQYPDWLQVDLPAPDHQRSHRLHVQDAYLRPVEPTAALDLRPVRAHRLHGPVLGRRAVADRAGRHDQRQPAGAAHGDVPAVTTSAHPGVDHRRLGRLQPPHRSRGLQATAAPRPGGRQRGGRQRGRHGLGVVDARAVASARRRDQRRPHGRQLGAGGGWHDATPEPVSRLAAGRFRGRQDHQRSPRLQRPGRLQPPVEPTTPRPSAGTGSPASRSSTGMARSGWPCRAADHRQPARAAHGHLPGGHHVAIRMWSPAPARLQPPHRGRGLEGPPPARWPRRQATSRPPVPAPGLGVHDLPQRLWPRRCHQRRPHGRQLGRGRRLERRLAEQFPDWLQVDFAGTSTISEVRVFSVQDTYTPGRADPDPDLQPYGVTSFTVQYWDGAQWLVVAGRHDHRQPKRLAHGHVPGRCHRTHPGSSPAPPTATAASPRSRPTEPVRPVGPRTLALTRIGRVLTQT